MEKTSPELTDPTEGALAAIWRREGEVVVRRIAGETLLVPVRGRLADMRQVFFTGRVGEFIWEHLDGLRTLAQLRDEITARFAVTPAEAGRDLAAFVAELKAAGLARPK